MLDAILGHRLKAAGLAWEPAAGDTFAIPDRDLDGQVFVVSDLVIEVREAAAGRTVLAFNGTTEWALDSLEVDEAVWLPREDQLRELLGAGFDRLERVPGAVTSWAVSTDAGRFVDLDPADAMARALLASWSPTG